jgi:hypothetical protein
MWTWLHAFFASAPPVVSYVPQSPSHADPWVSVVWLAIVGVTVASLVHESRRRDRDSTAPGAEQ